MTRAPHLQNRIGVGALRFAAATALLAVTQLAAGADPPRSVLRFEKAMIVDATGFEAPMAATTLFLPAGWKTQGGVSWGQQFPAPTAITSTGRRSPLTAARRSPCYPRRDGRPTTTEPGPSTPGCQAAPFTTARQYLEGRVVQRWHPGARPLDFRQREDLMRELRRTTRTRRCRWALRKTWVDAGELLFAFNEGGRDMRGSPPRPSCSR